MVYTNTKPSAGYNMNAIQDIRSHSSALFNERLGILFYFLDTDNLTLHTTYTVDAMLKVKAELWQIYKNFRMLIRYNPVCRSTLNLETRDEGVYVPDVMFSVLNQMVEFCEVSGYTTKRLHIIIGELDKIEITLRDTLQYFHYFMRPDFRQKPDIEIATETYKEIADSKTVEELRQIVGKHHKIDFDSLGSTRVPLNMPESSEYAPQMIRQRPYEPKFRPLQEEEQEEDEQEAKADTEYVEEENDESNPI